MCMHAPRLSSPTIRTAPGRLRLAATAAVAAAVLLAVLPAGAHAGTGGPSAPPAAMGAEFSGVIGSLPSGSKLVGDWTVGTTTVRVGVVTRVRTGGVTPAVGDVALVNGIAESDGTVAATAIAVLLSAPGTLQVSFHGQIQALPATADLTGDWTVSGKTVLVSATTTIDQTHGTAAVGAEVEVGGVLESDGSIDAAKIAVLSPAPGSVFVEFKGIIATLPGSSDLTGDWVVSGRTVLVASTTMIDQSRGAVAVGAVVDVEGTLEPDGSVDATRIEVLEPPGGKVFVAFIGPIVSLPASSDLTGDWVVGAVTVHVSSTTRLEPGHGAFAVGTSVLVNGLLNADGTVSAFMVRARFGHH